MLTNVVQLLIFWICAAIAGKYLPNAVHSQIKQSKAKRCNSHLFNANGIVTDILWTTILPRFELVSKENIDSIGCRFERHFPFWNSKNSAASSKKKTQLELYKQKANESIVFRSTHFMLKWRQNTYRFEAIQFSSNERVEWWLTPRNIKA